MKHILITFICLLIANQQIKGQNLSSELNAIALSNDMMGGAVVVFCENQVMNSFYFGKFLEANKKDFEGTLLYFRADYGEAHKPLKEAQGKIKELYEDALERHTEHTRVLVSYAAQRIIKTNDISSKHLMKLAFRDLKIAEDYYTLGWNQSPYQFRNKISLYEDGFRASRRARRFTLLALINFKTPNEDKQTYKKQSLSELQNSINEGKVNDYEYIKVTLRNFIENKLIEGKISSSVNFPRPKGATDYEFKANSSGTLDLMEMHDDNYGIITYNRISILEETNNIIRKDSPGPTTPETNAKPAPNTGTGAGAGTTASEPAKAPTNPPTQQTHTHTTNQTQPHTQQQPPPQTKNDYD